MKQALFIMGVAVIAGVGCGPVVMTPLDDGSGAAPILPGDPQPPDESPNAVDAIVLPASDVPDKDTNVGPVSLAAPDALAFVFTSMSPSCADPLFEARCDNGPSSELALTIPTEMVQPGAAIDLLDSQIHFFETVAFGQGPECGFGEGYGIEYGGTLEIVSVSVTQISVKLSGTKVSDDFSFDGDYVATRCE